MSPCLVFVLDVAEEKEETDEEDSDDEEEEDEDDTEVKEENGVLILNDNNYETFMEGKDTVLVEFYAPWYVCQVSTVSVFQNVSFLSLGIIHFTLSS